MREKGKQQKTKEIGPWIRAGEVNTKKKSGRVQMQGNKRNFKKNHLPCMHQKGVQFYGMRQWHQLQIGQSEVASMLIQEAKYHPLIPERSVESGPGMMSSKDSTRHEGLEPVKQGSLMLLELMQMLVRVVRMMMKKLPARPRRNRHVQHKELRLLEAKQWIRQLGTGRYVNLEKRRRLEGYESKGRDDLWQIGLR